MSKFDFKYNQRYAVYRAFKGICQWCKEPVDLRTLHVDHVLPEELLNDPQKDKAILATYGLPDTFNINDFENWIPAHSYCNLHKSDKVYEGLGIIKTILDSCANKKEFEQRIELKLNKEPKKAELLTSVQAAIELNIVNLNELRNFLLKTDIIDSNDEDLDKIRKSLEQELEYQTDKMVQGIMDMVKDQATDVINSIVFNLGNDWQLQRPIVVIPKKEDTKYTVRIGIKNDINYKLGVTIILNPNIIDNKLVIKFREGDGETFDTYTQDLQTGIEWEVFRKILRGHYKERLQERLEKEF